MPLSDNYKETDLALLMKQYEQALSAFNKAFKMIETAQFEQKNSVILELDNALQVVEQLNHKKRNADAVQSINEDTRRNMF